MARNTSLSQLLTQLQAEVGLSLLPASGTSSKDHRIQLLNRVQDRLYRSFDWDFSVIRRDVPVVKGDRFLTFPSSIDLERIDVATMSTTANGNDWRELGYGIGDGDYRQQAEGDQGSPLKWAPYEGGKFELWPAADGPYRVRFWGVATLVKMVADSDRAILDDTLIVLHAASEVLKRQKAPDWEDKLRDAQVHLTRLRAQMGGNKRAPFVMGGGVSGLIGDASPPPVQGLDYISA